MKTKALLVPSDCEGQRLDRWLTGSLPELSRSRLQKLIREGHVRIDGRPVHKPSTILRVGMRVEIEIPPQEGPQLEPEELSLQILYEDEDLVVVNKPSGVVVYPAAGHKHGTLVQGLLKGRRLASLGAPERPGVVHRLDKETSGVMVFAKSDLAYYELVRQFKNREVQKTYLALVHGHMEEDEGFIEAAIGRDLHHRQRLAIRTRGGKPAITEFRVLKRMKDATLLSVHPRTGRTHQIRVHLKSIGHPIVGDPIYGRNREQAGRLMLHAWKLLLTHPHTGQKLEFIAPPPPEFQPYLWGSLPAEGS